MPDKTAIFGGSFNPIHMGHIGVALHTMNECSLSRVVFLPNANPPHKEKSLMIAPEHRYNMTALAISDYDKFDISDYEMKRQAPSYTIDTMRYMKKIYTDDLYFIIGADSLYTLNTWKSYSELIKECRFIVADRNCTEGDSLMAECDRVIAMGGDVTVVSMPKIDITSTQIRQCISRGENVDKYLPQKVYDYILKNNLYKSNPED